MAVTAIALFLVLLKGEVVLTNVTPSIPVWLASGAIVGLGFIVPGLSPSNFLIYLGLYDKMANGIKNLDFAVVIPLVIGAGLCILIFAKLMTWLFDRYYASVYHFILGTIIGSSLVIFPVVVFPAFSKDALAASGLSFISSLIFCVVLLIIGIIISWKFSQLEERVERPR
jgi:putative membrane protein